MQPPITAEREHSSFTSLFFGNSTLIISSLLTFAIHTSRFLITCFPNFLDNMPEPPRPTIVARKDGYIGPCTRSGNERRKAKRRKPEYSFWNEKGELQHVQEEHGRRKKTWRPFEPRDLDRIIKRNAERAAAGEKFEVLSPADFEWFRNTKDASLNFRDGARWIALVHSEHHHSTKGIKSDSQLDDIVWMSTRRSEEVPQHSNRRMGIRRKADRESAENPK